jgi:hypothetical protein
MKLTEVDTTLTEGATDWVKAGLGALGSAAGYSPGREYAQDALEKNFFVNNFIKKMTGMLAQVWPQIHEQQVKAEEAKQFLQQVQQNKPVVFNGQTIQPTDPKYNIAANEMKKNLSIEPMDLAGYLNKVVHQYAGGYNLSQYENDLKQLSTGVAVNYQSNRGTADLKKIGELLYTIIKQSNGTQANAETPKNPSTLKAIISKLSELSPQDLAKLSAAIEKQKQNIL